MPKYEDIFHFFKSCHTPVYQKTELDIAFPAVDQLHLLKQNSLQSNFEKTKKMLWSL